MIVAQSHSIDFKRLQEVLESEDFYCTVAAVSTIPHFYRRLRSQEAVKLLIGHLRENASNVGTVLRYAENIAVTASGAERSEKDAALCACVVALSTVINPRVEEFLRWLRNSRVLSLAWASDLADYLGSWRAGITRRDWSPIGYLFLQTRKRASLSDAAEDTIPPSIQARVSDTENWNPPPRSLAA